MTTSAPTRTRPCRALDFDFLVDVDEPAVRDHLDDIFGGFPRPGPSDPVHEYVLRRDEGPPPRAELRLDGEVLERLLTPAAALAHLLWDLNRRAVAASGRFVLVHAGAVARRGPAIVLPASMESGKTTLVTGLLRAGFSYLTDEAAAIDPAAASVTPYPKALHLDYGSWPLFPDLAPQFDDERRRSLVTNQWHVPPGRLGAPVSETVPLGAVVFPRYEKGATTALAPISTATAVVELIANSFNFAQHGGQGLAAIASALEGARCHRLAVGDLDAACRLLTELDDDIADTEAA